LEPADVMILSEQFLEFYPGNKDKFEIPPDVIREVSARL